MMVHSLPVPRARTVNAASATGSGTDAGSMCAGTTSDWNQSARRSLISIGIDSLEPSWTSNPVMARSCQRRSMR